jgi:pilus assembly protein CpaC
MRAFVLSMLMGLFPSLLLAMDGTTGIPADITLSAGESVVLSADARRIAIAKGGVVSVTRPEKGQILLTGEAEGSTSAQLWLRDGSLQSLRIVVRVDDLSATLQQVSALLSGSAAITAKVVGRHIVLTGEGVSAAEQERAADVATLFPPHVLNLVSRVSTEPMLQMDVRVVEVRRDQLEKLGLRWAADAAGPVLAASASSASGKAALSLALTSSLDSRIDLLEQKGLAYTLAEPTLSCRSGGSARFVSGGEVPIPVSDGLGTANVIYKEYGVILEASPRITATGDVQAELQIELSQIDASVKAQDFPGFLKRKTSTVIETKEGQTVAIAGLATLERSRARQGLPGLSRLPLAGRAFSSVQRGSRETELVILVRVRRKQSDNSPVLQQDLDQRADRLAKLGEGA